MKKRAIISILIITLLTFSSCTSRPMQQAETAASTLEPTEKPIPVPTEEPTDTPVPEPTAVPRTDYPMKAMIIIGNEFGNTYFDMKQELEYQGFEVITVGVGEKQLYSSCPNHENQQVTADIDIAEITEENINDYSVVFIPAGKHHRALQYSKEIARVLNLCKTSYLYISSLCAGNIVLAGVDGLIEGYEISCSAVSTDAVSKAGGICNYSSVVVDGYFVTGKIGGGNSGSSHTTAPTKQLAEKLKSLIAPD